MRNFIAMCDFQFVIRSRTQILCAGSFIILLIAYCLLPTCIFSQTWHKLGIGLGGGTVSGQCLKVINNEIYVGGNFATSYGGPGNGIAKYNPSTGVWDSINCGIISQVNSIEEFNGEIYYGGGFPGVFSPSTCANWPYTYVPNTAGFAKWDGTQWLPPAIPNLNGGVLTMKYKNNLYIGGSGNKIDGASSITSPYHCCVFSYDGTNWGNMGGGIADSFGFPGVYTLAVYKNKLIVGGEFTHAAGKGGYNYIASWDGTQWDSLGSGMNWVVAALAVDTVSDLLYAGGGFTIAGGQPTLYYAVWDGTSWQAIYGPSPNLAPVIFGNGMRFFDGKLFVGLPSLTGSPYDTTLMYYNPPTNTWHQVYGPNSNVAAFEVYNGNLYVAGYFDKIDTTTVNGIACYGDSCPGTPITLTLPYGVQEFNVQNLMFKVYPNPAKREINIELAVGSWQLAGKEKYIVRIKNSVGQEIFQQSFPSTFQHSNIPSMRIDTSPFPKGLYVVEVCTLAGVVCHTEKVVIE